TSSSPVGMDLFSPNTAAGNRVRSGCSSAVAVITGSDVRIQAKDVRRVIAVLQRSEPLESVAVRILYVGSSLVRKEVGIHTGGVRAKCVPALSDPGPVAISIRVRRRPAGGHVYLEPDLSLAGSDGSPGIDAADGTTDGPSRDLGHGRGDALDARDE